MRWIGRRPGSGWSLGLAALLLGVAGLALQLRADDANPDASGAARLSSVDGQVRILQGGQVLADPALLNTPLFTGTQIVTGDDGKAEIQFDDGSVARISPDSSMTLNAIGNNGVTEIVLDGGLGYFELQGNGPGGDMRVVFSGAVVTAADFTVMRIRMDNPPGELAVFSGDAHLQSGNALAVDLHGGQSIALNASDPSRYNLAESIEPDSWDDWNADRDQALNADATEQTEASSSYANSDNPNPQWNDLDANGNWYDVPGQGYVWSPYEASSVGWDPYGCGHWMWTPSYGYVWISCESWGYLPYSYGTWSYYNGFGWGWSPGRDRDWWRGGRNRGINIGTHPRDYHPVPMPTPRGPIGRQMPRIIAVDRGGYDGGGPGLPVRNRNTPVEIGGHTVEPLRPLPGHQKYEPTQSGFVYRPSQGNRSTSNPGYGNQRWGVQGTTNPGRENPGTTNRGSSVTGARGGSNAGNMPSRRESYTPVAPPRYVAIPVPQPQPPNNGGPGGNNGAPNPGAPPNNGAPALGGLVPRDYGRTHPGSGVDRDGNGATPVMPRTTNGGGGFPAGGQQVTRPSNNNENTFRGGGAPRTSSPPPATFNRAPSGGQPSPRPSGGGGAPRPSGGGGGAPRSSGGGGAPHGGGRSVH